MRKQQKNLALIALIMLIVPQLAFASWWNPLSWSIFSFLFYTQPNEEIVQPSISILNDKAVITPTSTEPVTATTTVQMQGSEQKLENTLSAKPTSKSVQTSTAQPLTQVNKTPTTQAEQHTGTLCNGSYWNECPTGQDFVCPISGDAYCQTTKNSSQTESMPLQDNKQFCIDTYGTHTIWDESSSRCSCESGYQLGSDGKSCISNYLFCKNSFGSHAIWDEPSSGCACEIGYEPGSKGTSCVKQEDLSINSVACKTAQDNLIFLQEKYAGAVAAAGSSGSVHVAEGNIQHFNDQYNTKLPVYQLAAQAACQVPASNVRCQTALQNLVSLGAPFWSEATSWLGIISYGTEIQFACQ